MLSFAPVAAPQPSVILEAELRPGGTSFFTGDAALSATSSSFSSIHGCCASRRCGPSSAPSAQWWPAPVPPGVVTTVSSRDRRGPELFELISVSEVTLEPGMTPVGGGITLAAGFDEEQPIFRSDLRLRCHEPVLLA